MLGTYQHNPNEQGRPEKKREYLPFMSLVIEHAISLLPNRYIYTPFNQSHTNVFFFYLLNYLHDAAAPARRIRVGSQMAEEAKHRIVAYRSIVLAAMLVGTHKQTLVTTLGRPPGCGHLVVGQRRAYGQIAAHCGNSREVSYLRELRKYNQTQTNTHTQTNEDSAIGFDICVECVFFCCWCEVVFGAYISIMTNNASDINQRKRRNKKGKHIRQRWR